MKKYRRLAWGIAGLIGLAFFAQSSIQPVSAEIAASHVYHNHMPNFWPYYDTSQYANTAVGAPVRYMYDGDVIELKKSPPAGYPYFLSNGTAMPHDDLISYYSHHAKVGAYLSWPWSVANTLNSNHPSAQMQVTMSGSAVNNVNNITQRGSISSYNNPLWYENWKTAYNNLKTPNNNRTLDLIHFSGHHSLGPLVGNEYLLKDLIYQGATLAQPYFLGSSYKSSKGFFPTELGFSERIIPVLEKLGIKWSVIGNNHFSRTLQDYPLLDSPGLDTLVSPPNRADLQNVSTVGSWTSKQMFNEQQVVYNKYPFASTPHWVRYVNPSTGAESKVVGIPVAQAESWEEGYMGSVTADALKPYEGIVSQKQFFVVAHDGDNASGRAGSEETWRNAGNVTYSDTGVKGIGIDEYLVNNTPAASDVVHVQDGSWIDTRDSSSDPTWYHWRLPFGIWKGQFADFNRVSGLNLAPKKNLSGVEDGMTVSFEYGYHYLERNFALLQASLNYAKTAEQIWLDEHPNYWKPTTAIDREVTYDGNQLNPWMMSYPVKGNAANDYAGGANPAELAWYFLMPAMDSGFGYYDENVDDSVKPALSLNQSLFFSKPYVTSKLSQDRTGPSMWWPQRYPYNPGSANTSKAEGWTLQHYNNVFGIYTYAYDTSGLANVKVKIRTHTSKRASASDNTFKVYDPAALQAAGVANIDPSKVSAWTEYPMNVRNLSSDINGVDWQASSKAMLQKVPATEIGDLYYSYIANYRDQLLDYYIEATDSKGNVTRSDIQQVYVGAGKYNLVNGKYVESVTGTIEGTHPFITDQPIVPDNEAPTVPTNLSASVVNASSIQLSWTAATDNIRVAGYEIYRNGTKVGTSTSTTYTDSGLASDTTYSYNVKAYDSSGNLSALSTLVTAKTPIGNNVTIYYKQGYAAPKIHYRPAGGTWTTSPGVDIPVSEVPGYNKITINIGSAVQLEACFNNGSGLWDSNNGSNYLFNVGTWTYVPTGTINPGAPIVDIQAPSVPTNLTATASSSSGAVLSWTASTDNVGVTGYEIYRDGVKIGTTAAVTYTDSGLSAQTTYSYTIKSYDATGNLSAASAAASITTPAGNSVTIYYKQGYTAPKIHYRPVGGTWTTSPGVSIPAAEIAGYNKITINLGTATQLEACFNNGSGTWDNNGGSNYLFGVGTWTYTPTGSITSGAPVPAVADTTAPSTPTNLTATASSSTGAALTWTASTDNVGVTGYEVYRGAVKIGTTATTSYADSGLTAQTAYSYTVKAYDAAGNLSNASAAVSITTPAGNSVTIYYKQGYTAPKIHYRPVGGTWTTSPGVTMPAAEVAGYNKITIDLGSVAQLEACFNNGSGTWDSNGGSNYLFGVGTWTYTPTGSITSGAPAAAAADTTAPSIPTNVAATAASSASATITWTASTDNVAVTGYEIFRDGTKVATSASTTYTDTGLLAQTGYSYTIKAYDAAGNLSAASTAVSVTTLVPSAGNSVTIYYKNTAYTNSYIHYKVDGSSTWTALPGVSLTASTAYPGYKSITIAIGSATGLTASFNNGSGIWDNNGGNNFYFGAGTWSLASGGSITSGEPQADSVTFQVTVPANTPASSSVYLTGSFNSWNAADPAYLLTKGTDGVYSIKLNLTAGTAITYKVTRGTWTSVEVASSGSDISNRSLTPTGGAQTVQLTVARWKDL